MWRRHACHVLHLSLDIFYKRKGETMKLAKFTKSETANKFRLRSRHFVMTKDNSSSRQNYIGEVKAINFKTLATNKFHFQTKLIKFRNIKIINPNNIY